MKKRKLFLFREARAGDFDFSEVLGAKNEERHRGESDAVVFGALLRDVAEEGESDERDGGSDAERRDVADEEADETRGGEDDLDGGGDDDGEIGRASCRERV